MPTRAVSFRLLAVTAGLALLAGGCGGGGEDPLGNRAQFRQFALYYAGDSFQGHALRGGGAGAGVQRVGFTYGDCEPPEDEGGCALPIQIEVHAACARNRTSLTGPGSGPSRKLRIRWVPAAVHGEDDRLELHTGDVTVVIHAEGGLAVMRQVAEALRSVDGRTGPGDPLPRPARAALTGRARC